MGTHDRKHPDPLQRTWGHTMMLVLSVLMLAAGLVLVIYCGPKFADVHALGSELAEVAAFASLLYLLGLGLGVSMIVPAAVGLVSGMRSRTGTAALALAGIAIFLDVVFLIVMLAVYDATLFGAGLYFAALLVLPVLYGIAALKIRKG